MRRGFSERTSRCCCRRRRTPRRSEEHTSELQSLTNLVCPLLLEKIHPRHASGRRYRNQSLLPGPRRCDVLVGHPRDATGTDEGVLEKKNPRAFPNGLPNTANGSP